MTLTGTVPFPIQGTVPTAGIVPVINTWYSHQTAAPADDGKCHALWQQVFGPCGVSEIDLFFFQLREGNFCIILCQDCWQGR